MDVPMIYFMISIPETEMYMVVILANRLINMFHMEGLTLNETVWKYMEQICVTQFPKILKHQSL